MEPRELFDTALGDAAPRSPRVAALRDRLRGAVLAEADRRRTRRRTARLTAAAALAVVTATAAWLARPHPGERPPSPDRPPTVLLALTTVVRDDPTVADRLRVRTTAPATVAVFDRPIAPDVRLGDDELAVWLQAAGRPATVLRTDTRLVLVPAAE